MSVVRGGSSSIKLLTPLGVLVALALAAGVWFQPLKGLRPEPPKPEPVSGSGAGGDQPTDPEDQNHDWVALAAPLQSLRDPEVVQTENNNQNGEEGEDPEEDPRLPAPPDPYPEILRTWEYIGSIREPQGRFVAIVSVDGRQRFIRESQMVAIPKMPDRPGFEVRSITEEQVIFHAEDKDYTLQRKQPDPDPLKSRQPSRVDRLNPDGDRR